MTTTKITETAAVPPPLPNERLRPPPWLVLLTVLVLVVNAALAFAEERRLGHVASFAVGSALGQVVVPILCALVFCLGKRFRNWRASTYVVLCVAGLMLLGALGNLAK